ncbi:hypothetical protein [Brevundimonas sp. A19_0]|nr:hypothetical protein [Brevundimonas sp. A19_0]
MAKQGGGGSTVAGPYTGTDTDFDQTWAEVTATAAGRVRMLT